MSLKTRFLCVFGFVGQLKKKQVSIVERASIDRRRNTENDAICSVQCGMALPILTTCQAGKQTTDQIPAHYIKKRKKK